MKRFILMMIFVVVQIGFAQANVWPHDTGPPVIEQLSMYHECPVLNIRMATLHFDLALAAEVPFIGPGDFSDDLCVYMQYPREQLFKPLYRSNNPHYTILGYGLWN